MPVDKASPKFYMLHCQRAKHLNLDEFFYVQPKYKKLSCSVTLYISLHFCCSTQYFPPGKVFLESNETYTVDNRALVQFGTNQKDPVKQYGPCLFIIKYEMQGRKSKQKYNKWNSRPTMTVCKVHNSYYEFFTPANQNYQYILKNRKESN